MLKTQTYYYCCYYYSTGAEWWAQQFGTSLPFLNWLPFIAGKTVYFIWCSFYVWDNGVLSIPGKRG